MWLRGLPLAVLLVLSGCAGSEASIAPEEAAAVTATVAVPTTVAAVPPTTQPPETVPPTTVTAEPTDEEIEAAIIEAYLQGWDDYFAIVENPVSDPTFIERTHTGALLQSILELRDKMVANEQFAAWPSDSERRHIPNVLDVTSGTAVVRDCFVNDSFGVNADGSKYSEGLATSIWATSLVLEAGKWRAFDNERLARREGIWDCTE